MKKIEVFPEPEEADGKHIDGKRLEEFLKGAKTDWICKMMAGNVLPDDKFPTLCMTCQKLFNELEELRQREGKQVMADNCSEIRKALQYVKDTMLELQNGGSASSGKMLLIAEHALAAPARNCDVGEDWLKDFYCHFKPPKGMREMPPEWVDAITEFCKWLVSPANSKMEDK